MKPIGSISLTQLPVIFNPRPLVFIYDKRLKICYPAGCDWMWEMVRYSRQQIRGKIKTRLVIFHHSPAYCLFFFSSRFLFIYLFFIKCAQIYWKDFIILSVFSSFYLLASGYFPCSRHCAGLFHFVSPPQLCDCFCVCRTSKKNWHTYAAKCTCSSDHQLAHVQHGRLMNPNQELTFSCLAAEWGRRGAGVRSGLMDHPFSLLIECLICLQWPLLFSISPSLFPSFIYFF